MKQFGGFEQAKEEAKTSSGGSMRLPAGAYVCKILGAKETEPKDGKSGFITVQFEIEEGEYKGFFKKQYDANEREDKKYKGRTTIYEPKDDRSEQDGWTKNTFAKWTNAIEDSNPGYKWDWNEAGWKDKLVGIVFGETGTNINGKDIVYVEARYPVAVSKVHDGTAGAAKFKAKKGYGETVNTGNGIDIMNIPDSIDETLPF